MAFTTYFNFAKPAYKTVRYDSEINLNMDLIEAALLGFPNANPPGSANNYPDVTPSNGMRWIDITNNQLKVYYDSSWQVIFTFA